MHYVKHFNINGVDTKQVACIELQGKPNAATEGSVGLLGIDMSSPLHEIYKCVAVNGSIYTWELFSSGLSTIASTTSGDGAEVAHFPYDTLKIPQGYLPKIGDLIIDSKGYEYQVKTIDVTSCIAEYCGNVFLKGDKGDKGDDGEPGISPHIGENGNWWIGDFDTGARANDDARIAFGSYVGTGSESVSITCDFTPKMVIIVSSDHRMGYDTTTSEVGIISSELCICLRYRIGVNSDSVNMSPSDATVAGKTISWRVNTSYYYLNKYENTYYYTVFGE